MTLHVGKTVPEAMRAGLPPEIALAAGSVVQCWSCHDVHAGQPSGDVDRGRLVAALHARALAEDWPDVPADAVFPGANMAHPPMLALPLQGSALCAACHGVGP